MNKNSGGGKRSRPDYSRCSEVLSKNASALNRAVARDGSRGIALFAMHRKAVFGRNDFIVPFAFFTAAGDVAGFHHVFEHKADHIHNMVVIEVDAVIKIAIARIRPAFHV